MIDISTVMPCGLREAPAGSLFIPAVEGEQHFLIGLVGPSRTTVAVPLDRESNYRFAGLDQWRRSPGFIVEHGRFRVDPSSALLVDGPAEVPLGSMVRAGNSSAILGRSSYTNHPVWVGGEASRDIGRGDIAFTRWQIAVGSGADLQVLFDHVAEGSS